MLRWKPLARPKACNPPTFARAWGKKRLFNRSMATWGGLRLARKAIML